MGYRFSNTSIERLSTVDIRLQQVFVEVIKIIDITIVCGHRNAKNQNMAFASGNSKKKWPDSKHNEYPSNAIDVVPYPSMWDSHRRFYYLAGIVEATASSLGIKLRWGGNWDMDQDLDDNKFMDLGHWELVE